MSRFAPIFDVIKIIVIVFIVALVIRIFLIQPFIVEGSSMEPDFHDREYILIEKISYRFKQPTRGDVIVFHYPNNPSINYIKRVVGLPGETVHIENGVVSINGNVLNEPYLAAKNQTFSNRDSDGPYEVKLSLEQYFMMGDNRTHSSDSRDWGPLNKRYIIGRSTLVIYPIDEFQVIAAPSY